MSQDKIIYFQKKNNPIHKLKKLKNEPTVTI